jgi:hypothetical protein
MLLPLTEQQIGMKSWFTATAGIQTCDLVHLSDCSAKSLPFLCVILLMFLVHFFWHSVFFMFFFKLHVILFVFQENYFILTNNTFLFLNYRATTCTPFTFIIDVENAGRRK